MKVEYMLLELQVYRQSNIFKKTKPDEQNRPAS